MVIFLTSILCTAARGQRHALTARNLAGSVGEVCHGLMFTVQAPHPPCPHEYCQERSIHINPLEISMEK